MTSNSNAASATQLAASYKSPTTSKVFLSLQNGVTLSEERTVQQKTAYLSTLRVNVSQLQHDINTFLTQQMEDDKKREAAAATGEAQQGRKSKKDREREKREEEMYGEEDVDEDGRMSDSASGV